MRFLATFNRIISRDDLTVLLFAAPGSALRNGWGGGSDAEAFEQTANTSAIANEMAVVRLVIKRIIEWFHF